MAQGAIGARSGNPDGGNDAAGVLKIQELELWPVSISFQRFATRGADNL